MALLVSAGAMSAQGKVEVISEGLRFCESTYPYNGGLLIANFGTQELNPLNNEGQGYIMFHKDGKTEVLVAAICRHRKACLSAEAIFMCAM